MARLEDISQGLGKLGDSGGRVAHGDDALTLAAKVKADTEGVETSEKGLFFFSSGLAVHPI